MQLTAELTTCMLCPPAAAAVQGSTRWQDLLFNKLSDHIKLVGPTIR
jgi:hypothetical protein